MKKLSTQKIWLFATGQFGWTMLSGIISNWLVYFYQPDEVSTQQGQPSEPVIESQLFCRSTLFHRWFHIPFSQRTQNYDKYTGVAK